MDDVFNIERDCVFNKRREDGTQEDICYQVRINGQVMQDKYIVDGRYEFEVFSRENILLDTPIKGSGFVQLQRKDGDYGSSCWMLESGYKENGFSNENIYDEEAETNQERMFFKSIDDCVWDIIEEKRNERDER